MSTTINTDVLYNVTNRSTAMVSYVIPEMNNLRRDFAPGETKRLPYKELEALSFIPGGKRLIYDYLKITDATVTENLDIHTEREYWMSAEDVKKMLVEGSLDELLDCLDFAPDGVIDLVKDLAVKLPLNDVAKREAIKEKTGLDITKAIENMAPEKPEDKPAIKIAGSRRVPEAPAPEAPAEPQRRVKYTVVNPK